MVLNPLANVYFITLNFLTIALGFIFTTASSSIFSRLVPLVSTIFTVRAENVCEKKTIRLDSFSILLIKHVHN